VEFHPLVGRHYQSYLSVTVLLGLLLSIGYIIYLRATV
jgi:hypothetical protein